MPNRISLTGHTDITPYPGTNGYTNWDLSADRANAARRALDGGGLPDEKISRVVGLSLIGAVRPQRIRSNPINRRISIVVMTTRGGGSRSQDRRGRRHSRRTTTAATGRQRAASSR